MPESDARPKSCTRQWCLYALCSAPLVGIGLGLILLFGNPQWHGLIYCFQAYRYPGFEDDIRNPPPGYTGIWRTWYRNGNLRDHRSLKDGQFEGISTNYYHDGAIRKQTVQYNHALQSITTWYINGQKEWEHVKEPGGWVDRFWYETGEKQREELPTADKEVKRVVSYARSGKVLAIGQTRESRRHSGVFRAMEKGFTFNLVYYLSGRRVTEAEYRAATKKDPSLPRPWEEKEPPDGRVKEK